MDFAPQLYKRFRSGSRVLRACIATALITLLVSVNSVQAETIRINQVIQTLSTTQGPAELKLITTIQDPGTSTPRTTNDSTLSQVSKDPKVDALLAGFPVVQDPQKIGVEVIQDAEVEGTICDCGDKWIPGGFPKWPLLFLAAVPLAFIDTDTEETETPNSTPTPTPTPPTTPTPTPTPAPVPEPASLLLFGTGLAAIGAGLRRRYATRKVSSKLSDSETEK